MRITIAQLVTHPAGKATGLDAEIVVIHVILPSVHGLNGCQNGRVTLGQGRRGMVRKVAGHNVTCLLPGQLTDRMRAVFLPFKGRASHRLPGRNNLISSVKRMHLT